MTKGYGYALSCYLDLCLVRTKNCSLECVILCNIIDTCNVTIRESGQELLGFELIGVTG